MMVKKMIRPQPSFKEELLAWSSGYRFVAGIDEVGRGAFAGPIVAAAVILPSKFHIAAEIYDSKLLTPRKREELAKIITNEAVYYSISEVPVPYINKYGIGKANQLVMRKAIKSIEHKVFTIKYDLQQLYTKNSIQNTIYYLVDGFPIRKLSRKRHKHLIRGDQLSVSIASASILAKVHRDALMSAFPGKYQKYGFAMNKGYGTKYHRDAIFRYGLSDLHRTSFNLQKFLPR